MQSAIVATGARVQEIREEIDAAMGSQSLVVPQLPLDKARKVCAKLVHAVFRKAWVLGMHELSARRVAARYFRQPNELISKWRTNKKPMPVAALLIVPQWILVEIVNAIFKARGMKEYEP